MDKPEYWQDDETWDAYNIWLNNQPNDETNQPEQSDLKKTIEKARGNQKPPEKPMQFHNKSTTYYPNADWQPKPTTYKINVNIIEDQHPKHQKIYSVIATNLPGIGSCGSTIEEALKLQRSIQRRYRII